MTNKTGAMTIAIRHYPIGYRLMLEFPESRREDLVERFLFDGAIVNIDRPRSPKEVYVVAGPAATIGKIKRLSK